MFCPNCGNNVPDGNAFCPNCGSSLAAGGGQQPVQAQYQQPAQQQYQQPMQQQYQQPMYNQPAAAAANPLGNIAGIFQGIPLRLVAKIAFLAALVCFLFPFVSVSCDASAAMSSLGAGDDDYSFEVEYKGYNLIFPSTIGKSNIKMGSAYDDAMDAAEEEAEDEEDVYGSDSKPSTSLIIAAICCIAGCVVLFIKKDWLFSLISAGCALIGMICLFVFKSGFVKNYLTDEYTEMEGMDISSYLKVNFKFGFTLCVIMVIVALLSCLATFVGDKFGQRQN